MGFRLVPQLVTLNNLKQRNARYRPLFCVILPNSVSYVKAVEDIHIHVSPATIQSKEYSF